MNENGKDNQIKDLIGSMTAEEWLRIRGAADLDELREALISIKARKAGKVTTFKKMAERIKRDAQAPGADQHKTLKDIIPYFYPAIEDIDGGTIEAIESEIEAAGGIAAVYDYIRSDAAEELEKRTREFYETIGQAIQEVIKAAGQLAAKMAAINPNVDFNAIVEASQLPERLTPEIEALLPDFIAEHPEYNGVTAQDIVSYFIYGSGLPIPNNNPFEPIITKALERIATGTDLTAEEIERIIISPLKNIKSILQPIDKMNIDIWGRALQPGQMQIAQGINTAPQGKEPAIIYYSLEFSEQLTPAAAGLTLFDELVYMVVDTLYRSGNKDITATQIYQIMNGPGKAPGTWDKEKINKSLTKMGFVRIIIDNEKESEVQKGYTKIEYDEPLLSFKRFTGYVNGKMSDSVIHVMDRLPLMEFARDRKQVVTLDRRLLEAPISKTEKHLRLQNYLFERIGIMKNPKRNAPRKILFSTLFERCGLISKKNAANSDSERKAQNRAKEDIRTYLDHFIKCKWIKGYSETKDGITIEL